MSKQGFQGSILLFLTAFFWGSTFVAQSSAAGSLPPFAYLSARSYVGALSLLFFLLFRYIFKTKKEKNTFFLSSPKALWKEGALCGILLFFGSILQQYGMEYGATAGEAGFLTAVYMFIVPLLNFLFYKKKAGLHVLFGAILTGFGLYCLLERQGGLHFGIGQGMVLLCSLAFAFHILALDRCRTRDPIGLSFVQFTVCALLSTVFSLLFDEVLVSTLLEGWFPIIYAGVFSSAIAYTLQIAGQKRTTPTVAAVIMSSESVISLLCEWICAKLGWVGTPFSLSFLQIVGCTVAFIGIILAELPLKTEKAKNDHL